ncbi:hypothetical protein Fmac_007436 [Flemingia macrophylla]|uniref:Uncharacterized protein n=1 Tax=Flemingia macrophylla TaxID=520843 RepID=A0ABD1MV16_9FABA
MKRHVFSSDPFTFSIVFVALSLVADRKIHYHQFHYEVLKWGVFVVSSVLNTLISSYISCASSTLVDSSMVMASVRKLFDQAPPHLMDEPSLITIIAAYVRNGDLATVRFEEFKASLGEVEEWKNPLSRTHGGGNRDFQIRQSMYVEKN